MLHSRPRGVHLDLSTTPAFSVSANVLGALNGLQIPLNQFLSFRCVLFL